MMDIPMMDSYLEAVAGYICDEDKLVTYKWLSKELEVHVNIAKIILWRYWQKHKKDVLVATFMLIGNLKEGGMRVEVVKDCDLEKAKEKFEKIISEHIYSLQKTLMDIELLAGAGKGDSRFSAITCEKSVVLSEDELLAMRWGKAQPPKVTTTEKKGPPQPSGKKDPPTIKETPKKEENTETEAKSEEKPKKISPPKQKSNEKKGVSKKPVQSTKAGFGHLFAKAGNQQKPQTSSSSNNAANDNSKKDSAISPETKASNSTDENSTRKGKSKENEDSTNVPKESVVSSPDEKEDKKSPSDSRKSEKPGKIDKAAPNKKTKPSKSKKSNRGVKRGRSQDSGEETKKRKRIIIASDSSEESANESADEDMFESPPPPSPKKNKSPSPPPVKLEGNKRKVRKLVDKTFMDEDGYLITRKEHVYESCSEDEAEVVEEKKKIEAERPRKETKESKAPVKKKQTSLMSFFKKA